MVQEHYLPYCRLELHETHAIVTTSEGVNIDFAEVQEINAILQNFYEGKPFGLIANRENRYSINPLAAKQFFSDECVVAGAVVGKNLATKINAEIENDIIDGAPIVFFTELSSAVIWIDNRVKKEQDKASAVPI
jgi:hypothetical protein